VMYELIVEPPKGPIYLRIISPRQIRLKNFAVVLMLPSGYGKTAIHSISTAAFRGNAATCTHVRAGIAPGLKYYTWS